jgi:hypothetical protein
VHARAIRVPHVPPLRDAPQAKRLKPKTTTTTTKKEQQQKQQQTKQKHDRSMTEPQQAGSQAGKQAGRQTVKVKYGNGPGDARAVSIPFAECIRLLSE